MMKVVIFEDTVKNLHEFLTRVMNNEKEFIVDEGADLNKVMISDMPFVDLCKEKGISLRTFNLAQDKIPGITVQKDENMLPFLYYTKNNLFSDAKDIQKHFGLFVGGSRWHRLFLASNLYNHHKDQSIISYRQSVKDPKQPCNLHIDDLLLRTYKINSNNFLNEIMNFVTSLPLQVTEENNDNTGYINFDKAWDINKIYSSIFVDVVCETWHNGKTFYPTEKIARPIACSTPFIVYAGKNFLANLKKLGFKTFNDVWDESYDKFEGVDRIMRINALVKKLSNSSLKELRDMHEQIKDVLIHNVEVYKSFKNGMEIDLI